MKKTIIITGGRAALHHPPGQGCRCAQRLRPVVCGQASFCTGGHYLCDGGLVCK